jgi:hypothetical protein
MMFRKLITLPASTALLLVIGTAPGSAIDLGETLGGVTDTVTNTVSSTVSAVTNTGENGTTVNAGVASVTVGDGTSGGLNVNVDSNLLGGTNANVNLLGSNGVATASVESGSLLNADLSALSSNGVVKANSTLLNNSIRAELDVLTTEDLIRVCIGIGGGEGCNIGDRTKLLGLIDTRLGLLDPRQLLSLCLNIGSSGCGIVDQGGGNGGGGYGGGGNGGGGGVPPVLAGMSSAEIAVRQRKCLVVFKRPFEYEADLVDLC